MSPWTLQPLNYTTPPFAAASGIVENAIAAPIATSTPGSEPELNKPVFRGSFWGLIAAGAIVVLIVAIFVIWWKRHQTRLAGFVAKILISPTQTDVREYSGFYDELHALSNYEDWRERQDRRLLERSTDANADTNVEPSHRGSEDQKSESDEDISSRPATQRKDS